jgi:hypothetical protein
MILFNANLVWDLPKLTPSIPIGALYLKGLGRTFDLIALRAFSGLSHLLLSFLLTFG